MADVKYTSHTGEFNSAFERAFDIGMDAVAKTAEANAIREVTRVVYDTPPSPYYVRTGTLRNNIKGKYVKEEKAAYVGTNVEYAPYVELGTRYMRARPFLRPAAMNHSAEYRRILEDALKTIK